MTEILAVVVVFGGLIFFHELGHFGVARAFGMGVSTFSLGFGPKLLKKKGICYVWAKAYNGKNSKKINHLYK